MPDFTPDLLVRPPPIRCRSVNRACLPAETARSVYLPGQPSWSPYHFPLPVESVSLSPIWSSIGRRELFRGVEVAAYPVLRFAWLWFSFRASSQGTV